MTPIRQISRKNYLMFRLERLRDSMGKHDARRAQVEVYRHCVGCGYFNEDGLHHVGVFLELMEG